ncbi:CDP-alcohol phosphatidyltransferase family protein [Paralimibaculum aggregatum]|uniref:CDP-alcohol phosphatidyltransferase family protein n=1 Tax=Paralimibaculum aggregatum TaxID=3036245 RepID=A0ABQ6LFF3_9RHOB|nr:CDP-alcohol phosphatidyltransferase family protein [Limibaculum sp. NKW23]GMG82053.1 CDP-alcohol phosphatidyltransferase family protein [Limibaculum sp. NKW23]
MSAEDRRRPIPQREAGWARAAARRLAERGIAPNRISQASLAAAALAGLALALAPGLGGGLRAGLLVLAAALILLRLLCNMFDGMVAVEGGKGTADGPFWNEVPDRAADLAVLVGCGIGAGVPALGWAAGAMALGTAYVRAFGEALGQPPDFSGPMAKPQRMWAVIAAALAAAAEPLWGGQGEALRLALWAVALGAGFTALRRGRRLLTRLARAGQPAPLSREDST